jgi:SPOR domain
MMDGAAKRCRSGQSKRGTETAQAFWGLNMARASIRHLVLAAVAIGLLAGCEDGASPFGAASTPSAEGAAGAEPQSRSVRLVDRDVEAPEVFQVTEKGLWDGRPSLGGVWVASPDATDPERVILRNPANGTFVIGALFRRERDNPGPELQISSDAAEALGLLAGEPAVISVTALRREEAPVEAPDAAAPILDAAETVETEALDPIAAAGAAIDRAEGEAAPASPSAPVVRAAPAATAAAKPAAATAAAAPATAPAATAGARRIQIGIFSVEANAKRAADTLGGAGITAEVRQDSAKGKSFWSVLATGGGDPAALLAKVKGLGFTDAYFVR